MPNEHHPTLASFVDALEGSLCGAGPNAITGPDDIIDGS